MAEDLYIIDGHAHIYGAYYAPMRNRLTSPDGEPTKAAYIFTTMLLGLIEKRKPDMLAVAMDSKTPSFRTEIYKEYKAHRPPMPEDLPKQIERIEQILEAMNIPMIRVDGYEADDIIGTLAKEASRKNINCFICSKDKDMLQLLDERVKTFDIKNLEEFGLEEMMEKMDMTPEQFIDVLALQGDTSDNIPGVPDVGPKTALGWIQKYGTIGNLYEHADEIKGKRGKSLRDSKEQLELSRQLVVIDTKAPVEFDTEKFRLKEPDRQALAEIFTRLGFTRLLGSMHLKSETEQTDADGNSPGVDEPESAAAAEKDYRLINTPKDFDEFFREFRKQKMFSVDTETTSLDAMRAELAGICISWKSGSGYYLAVKGPMGAKTLDIKMLREKLGPVFADGEIKKIAQNFKYDLNVLCNAGLGVNGIFFDTMVASYVLNAERGRHSLDAMAEDYLNYNTMPISSLIGKGKNQLTFDMVDLEAACEYAAEDADITFRLYEYLSQRLAHQPELEKLFNEIEMPLVDVLAKMERAGVSLDLKLLREMSVDLSEQLDALTDKIFQLAGGPFNIDSPKQLAEILFDRIGLKSIRNTKTSRSTDAAVLEQLSDQHEMIPLILEYRQLMKLKNTYVDKLGELINPRTDRVHASFNQTVTATGRLSSSDPNLQNIPIRTEIGRKIRSAFIPGTEDCLILSADYSQIELRLLAHFSKDRELTKAFEQDRDIHAFVASQIYGVEQRDVTSEMRSACKAVNFGIIYGQGPFGLSKTIGIPQHEAKKFIEDYFNRYSSIKKFMDETVDRAKKTGYAETILKRRRAISGLSSRNFNTRTAAERMTINTTIQGSAADLIKAAMINIQRKIDEQDLPVKMILQIHDELVFEVPSKYLSEHEKWINEMMVSAIELDVPLKVDTSAGPTWMADK